MLRKHDSKEIMMLLYIEELKKNMNHIEYSNYLINLGVGEILLQNIDNDGTMKGFDKINKRCF